jgi:hypothetical protein
VNLLTLLELLQTLYCERVGHGPFDEPLNAISNLAFAIAAVLAAMRIRAFPGASSGAKQLPWTLGAVAVGSTLYHTFRSPVTFVVDLLPLIAFILGAIFLVLRRIMTRSSEVIGVGTAFIGLQIVVLFVVPNDYLNGSTPHVLTFGFILLLMVPITRRYGSLVLQVVPIATLYALGIVFRTVDMALCPWLPTGTHFLWHIAGAAAGYSIVRFVSMIEVAVQVDLVAT